MENVHYTQIPDGMLNYNVPTKFESILVGVQNITQDKTGKITVLYLDETKLSCMTTKDLFTDFTHIFQVLDYVQERNNENEIQD